jgi:hypothetical protein
MLLRPFIALYVRLKEISFSPLIDHFILAEAGYEKELSYLPKRKTVVENKLKPAAESYEKKSKADGLIHLLFSGTLAETTGVFQAIQLAKALYQIDSKIRLTLIGYCAQSSVLEKIKSATQTETFIELHGGNALVPHQEILKAIYESDFGIISYPSNPSTENALPTKLYEYLGCQLPILLTEYTPWVQRCVPPAAAIVVNFNINRAEEILHKMKSTTFYTSHPTDVHWEDEKFRNVIEQFIG